MVRATAHDPSEPRQRGLAANLAGVEYGTQVPSFDSGSGRDPIDPDFAGLFRPDESPPAPADDDEPHFEPIVDPVIDPRDEAHADDVVDALAQADPDDAVVVPPAPGEPPSITVPPDPIADTGRLFRSQGVVNHDEAVLALTSDHAGRLRTLARRDEAVLPDAGPVGTQAQVDPDGEQVPGIDGVGAAVDGSRRRRTMRRGEQGHRARGVTGGAVYLIVIGVTVLVAFANVLIADGKVGWPTGLALVISSVYAALTVRREDDTVAIIVPPVAFLVAALTAGQLSIGSAENSLLNRAVVAFFTLADNWIWIIGATAASLVIVLVRRRRG
jgi:hypothetical protein